MTDAKPPGEPLDADEIKSQAAALAAHLQRSGVHWLPKPREESVAALSDRFADQTSSGSGELRSAQPTAADKLSKPAPIAKPNRPPLTAPPTRLETVSAFASASGSYPGPLIPIPDRQPTLDLLSSEVSTCTRCEVLSSCRKKTVFGEGSVSARVAFFGEGPGADEDLSGRPFVGRAGQLLTKMIEACKFKREDVYIFNTVKCRPPGNRNPEPDEIENCRPFYEQQLAVIRPEYIVCLGAVSAQELLKSKLPVGRLRGKLHRYFESKVLVTYHPAYLLRNPAAKKAAWTDLQLMLRDAGIEV